jgi:tetratricopeptide (TPR) repeat protein
LYLYSGREDEAVKLWTKMEKFDPVDTYSRMMEYEASRGRLDAARELLEKLERVMPDTVGVVGARGMLAAMEGDAERARQIIVELENSYQKANVMPNYVAYVYYLLGDFDKTFEWLNRAVEVHSLIPHSIRFSPMFVNLRKDPRYRQLLIRNGLNPDNED